MIREERRLKEEIDFSLERIGPQYVLPFVNSLEKLQFVREPKLFEKKVDIANLIVSTAYHWIGYPAASYRGENGGLTPNEGFDCSGFILYILGEVKKQVPNLYIPDGIRHANEMFDRLGIFVDDTCIQYGDLVFFSRRGRAITHIGIYCGVAENGKKYIIHSPGVDGKKVELTTLEEKLIPLTYHSHPRLYNKNPVGFKRPTLMSSHSRWRQIPIA